MTLVPDVCLEPERSQAITALARERCVDMVARRCFFFDHRDAHRTFRNEHEDGASAGSTTNTCDISSQSRELRHPR